MDIEALTSKIKPLDLSNPPITSPEELAYFRHYNLNIEESIDNVNHYFGHFECGRFDIVAHYYDKKNARGTCFIFHGYYDHAGLYSHVIKHCLQNNQSVVIYDLPGHGLSTGQRACINDFNDYQTVLDGVIQRFSGNIPEPWHGIAQSTGAAVLMHHLLLMNNRYFSNVVLLAPLLRPVGWKSGMLAYHMIKYFFRRIPRTFSNNSNDRSFIEFLRNNDPLQASDLSLQWVGALKKWMNEFMALEASDAEPLIIQGEDDTTVDWEYNIPNIKNKFPKAKVLYLKKGRHHLANENEDIRGKIFSAIDLYFESVAATVSLDQASKAVKIEPCNE